MTWPPPPPSSDPWSTRPDPDGADDPPATEMAREPAPEALWEPLADPVADSDPEELSQTLAQPVEPAGQPIDQTDAASPVPSGEYVAPPASVSEQAAPHGGWSSAHYGPPPPVVPRPQMGPPQQEKPVWLIAAAVLGVVVIGVVVWLLVPSGDPGGTTAAQTTTSPTRTADPRAEADLRRLLPRGYGADSCEMQAPPAGALAKASCGVNLDPGGPPSATYTITADDTALDAEFNDVIEASSIVTCPGNIQSPGPWRRNATPLKVSGVLFCGLQGDRPVLAWTNTDESLVAVVKSGPQGPGLDQLYTWWSSHS